MRFTQIRTRGDSLLLETPIPQEVTLPARMILLIITMTQVEEGTAETMGETSIPPPTPVMRDLQIPLPVLLLKVPHQTFIIDAPMNVLIVDQNDIMPNVLIPDHQSMVNEKFI